MKKYGDLVLTLLLFSIVILLAFKHFLLNSEHEKLVSYINQNSGNTEVVFPAEETYIEAADLYSFLQLKPFSDIKPIPLKENQNTRLKIMILFDVDDCGACFAEAILWEELYQEFENVSVYAVVSGHNQAKVEYLLRGLNINIPFLYDPKATIAQSIGLMTGVDTPMKLVINNENKVISQSRTLYGNRDAHERYKNIVRSILL